LRGYDQTIQVSEDGTFHFVKEIERPVFLDISYANLEWPVFLSPESSLDIQISGRSLDAVEYRGDLVASNTYLLGVEPITREINAFFNENWAFFKYRFTNSLIFNQFHPQLSRSDRYDYIILTFQIRDE